MKNVSIIRKLFIGFVAALLFVSCQSMPFGYVSSFERFVERVERNATSYSRDEWKKNDEQLRKFVGKYDTEKQKLSTEERRKVGELTMRYYKVRVKAKGLNIIGEIDGWLEYLKGLGDGLAEDTENN